MPRRENSRRRRPPTRRSRPLVLVVCGAKRTEMQYLSGLRAHLGSRAIDIQIVDHPRSPEHVVTYARDYVRRSHTDFDETWCVVDVDNFDLNRARRTAVGAGIELAISSPCFELWLLLHYEQCAAYLPKCSDAHRKLQKHIVNYDKADLRFTNFVNGLNSAIARAKALNSGGVPDSKNPSTSVWRLVERMME